MQTDKLHIISGLTREDLAEAFLEYRAFIRENPGDGLAGTMAEVLEDMRIALRQRRALERAMS